MRSEITVRDIVQPNVLSCSPNTPLAAAAARMTDARCSSILVEEDGKAIGIWTEHDALALDLSEPTQLRLPVSQFMSHPVLSLSIGCTLGEAALRFREEGVRHFLVVGAEGERRGIISQTDIVLNQGIEYFVSLRELESVFTRKSVTVSSDMPLAQAVREMHAAHLDALVVRGPEGAHGILTERDVIRLISSGRRAPTVGEIASFPLLTLPLNATLYHARKLFKERRVRHLGVTSARGEVLGLISFSGILANIEHEYVRHLREALRESEASLAASNQRLRSAAKAFESTLEGILVTDANRVIESVNPAFTNITGFSAEDVIGKTPSILASGRHDREFYRAMREALERTGHWQGEICNRRKNGQIFFEWVHIDAVKNDVGAVTNYVAVFSDFTLRKAAEEQMQFLAHHDALTGLPNRALFMQRLLRAMPHAKRAKKELAVVFFDLDDFKKINDGFGHDAGDHILKAVAQRLLQGTRAEDTVARLGGDEFILLVEEISDFESLTASLGKLLESIAHPVEAAGREIRTSASAGVSVYPGDAAEPEELIRSADAAMYLAKARGGNALRFFAQAGGERP